MKINFKSALIILFFVVLVYPRESFAQGLSSNELLKNTKQYDGKLITYSGEVIGDVMLRKASKASAPNAWVNINDGENALGVWMDASFAKIINYAGSYKTRGDHLEVTGIFHRACLEHGGDLDIHAQAVRKLTNGSMVQEAANSGKINLSFVLLGVLLMIWILSLFRKK